MHEQANALQKFAAASAHTTKSPLHSGGGLPGTKPNTTHTFPGTHSATMLRLSPTLHSTSPNATHAAHPEPWPARATTPGTLQAPSIPRAASLCALAYTSPVPPQAGRRAHRNPAANSISRYEVVVSRL